MVYLRFDARLRMIRDLIYNAMGANCGCWLVALMMMMKCQSTNEENCKWMKFFKGKSAFFVCTNVVVVLKDYWQWDWNIILSEMNPLFWYRQYDLIGAGCRVWYDVVLSHGVVVRGGSHLWPNPHSNQSPFPSSLLTIMMGNGIGMWVGVKDEGYLCHGLGWHDVISV